MAISVGRLPHPERSEQLARYGARLVALASYTAAVAVAFALLAPVLRSGEPAPVLPEPVAGGTYTVRPGDTLALIAADRGISVARILALNPDVEPLRLAPGAELRVR